MWRYAEVTPFQLCHKTDEFSLAFGRFFPFPCMCRNGKLDQAMNEDRSAT